MTDPHHHAYHDMGGQPAGAINQSEHVYAFWEKRVDALMVLLSAPQHQFIRVDELRRSIESLGPDVYDRLSYYERWIAAIAKLLLEKGVLGQGEIDARIAELRRRGVGKP